ncbi:MAG: UvrD-helicase domain-containing protein, partial [Treponema sp.]|nr:UvrD-helicase domain-containing protein [Treponema sp.]
MEKTETLPRPALNEEQSRAAYCEQSAVVSAGAGSGKTMVLASRYSWLITEKKIRAPEILTLTFTKKAAAQMYRRIHLELSRIAREGQGEKSALAQRALDEFAHARIQTLDSYCASIARQASGRYGVSPDFSIDEERCRRLAADISLPFAITMRAHPAMEKLYSRKSPMRVARDIFSAALCEHTGIDFSRDDFQKNINGQFEMALAQWKKQSAVITGKLDALRAAHGESEKYHPDLGPLLARYESAMFPGEKELADYLTAIREMPGEEAVGQAESSEARARMISLCAFLSSINTLNLAKGSPRNNPAKDILKELRLLFADFSSLIVFFIQAGLIYSSLALLSELQEEYAERKRSQGALAFADVARLARTILLEQRDIRQSEKEAFKAIM